jgi:predicted regulator of Ras-like GTPase activity (Roadblock/LC7/MglB family)
MTSLPSHPVPQAMTTALATLRDVAGINGSFVFGTDGRLVAREIHAMFDDAALSGASERLARLRETFAAVGDELDLAIIRFQDHKLFLKVLPSGVLCILAESSVNMPALRMAANVVGRRLAGVLAGAAALPAASPEVVVPAEVAPAEPPPPAAPRARGVALPGMRRFRGHTLE